MSTPDTSPTDPALTNAVARWRLVLGRYAASRLPACGHARCAGGQGSGNEGQVPAGRGQAPGGQAPGGQGQCPDGRLAQRREAALDFLYGREYSGRGVREDHGGERSAGLGDSQPYLVTWLGEVRDLFPRETVEVIERHALERYDLKDLVTDPEVLQRLEPNEHLLRTLLMLRGHLSDEVLTVARGIIKQVVDDLTRRLAREIRQTVSGRRQQFRHSPVPISASVDLRDTIRRNLRHWDPERQRLVVHELRYFEHATRRFPWDIIICVDQSGSMADSVIHSAVMAGILAGLPTFRLRLVVFDTDVVDLTDQVDDPVEVLMSVQLGGGTHIAQAIRYCADLVEYPERTVLAVVSDFYEGGSPRDLIREVRALVEQRVRLIGLAALDSQANPDFDRTMARQLVDAGMPIAALTPRQFAEWLAEVTS